MKPRTTFKKNDRVYCLVKGWGNISQIVPDDLYAVSVKFDSGGYNSYTLKGQLYVSTNQTLLFSCPMIDLEHYSTDDNPSPVELTIEQLEEMLALVPNSLRIKQ